MLRVGFVINDHGTTFFFYKCPKCGRGGTTPAAALTGYTGPEHRASVLRAGFQYHVPMPIGILELTGVVAILALKA